MHNPQQQRRKVSMFRQSSPSFTAFLFATINIAVFVTAVDPERPGDQIMELYMHDILGGNNPTARPNHGFARQHLVPFARPLCFRPLKDGVAILNANGAIPTVNINGVPLGIGLAGTSFAGGNKKSQTANNQLGPDGLGLGFGTITVIDDMLTSSPELGTRNVGGSRRLCCKLWRSQPYGDSLNFFGVYRIGSTMSQLSVTGGTGKFKNACGFTELHSIIPAGQHVTNRAETLIMITVHLTY